MFASQGSAIFARRFSPFCQGVPHRPKNRNRAKLTVGPTRVVVETKSVISAYGFACSVSAKRVTFTALRKISRSQTLETASALSNDELTSKIHYVTINIVCRYLTSL